MPIWGRATATKGSREAHELMRPWPGLATAGFSATSSSASSVEQQYSKTIYLETTHTHRAHAHHAKQCQSIGSIGVVSINTTITIVPQELMEVAHGDHSRLRWG